MAAPALMEAIERREAIASLHSNSPLTLVFDPDALLDCETLERAAQNPAHRFRLSEEAIVGMERSQKALSRLRETDTPIYGLTTGFGPFVRYGAAENGGCMHGAGLIAHLGAGCGPLASPDIVRATMILRVNTLAQGYSGVRMPVVEAYLQMLEHGLIPAVPEIGSVGASGDLIPLSHIARVLTGEGDVIQKGNRVPACFALREADMQPLPLDGRDALALTNGTSFLTAYCAAAVARAERLISFAERLTGWMYRALGCRASALDPRLHRARGHAGQYQSAKAIRREAGLYGEWEDTTRPLQEIYSLRCAPQVLGACRENLSHARRLVEAEMNGVNDNPLIFDAEDETSEPIVLHGGNFHGQQVGFAADALNAALTQVAVLVDRQIDALLDPRINGGAPLLLAWDPGATSGMAGAQITATALTAEMRMHTQSYATSSIPTNGGNQDIVPMATLAAREAFAQTTRLAPILSVAGMALVQLDYLREQGRAPGRRTPAPDWMPFFAPFQADRPLQQDIERMSQCWLSIGK